MILTQCEFEQIFLHFHWKPLMNVHMYLFM